MDYSHLEEAIDALVKASYHLQKAELGHYATDLRPTIQRARTTLALRRDYGIED